LIQPTTHGTVLPLLFNQEAL